MFNIFKPKPSNVSIQGIGEFKYYKDKVDEYWELNSKYSDTENAIDLDFCALTGSSSEINFSAKKKAMELLAKPNKLWELVNEEFIKSVSKDINEISKATVKNHFYIKSLTIESESSYEVGFHALNLDIFLELFVRNGSVNKLEKDYDCCGV